MSKHITLQVTEEQERALGLLLSLIGVADAPAKTAKVEEAEVEHCSVPRKDGKPCQGTPLKGRTTCVAHSRKAEPKGKSRKAAPKAKTEGLVALRQATRKEFIAAVKAEQGIDLTGKSTREVAKLLVAKGGKVEVPEGFTLGERYYELAKEQLQEEGKKVKTFEQVVS